MNRRTLRSVAQALTVASIALLAPTAAVAAQCPVGGSEHSFGTGFGCEHKLDRPASRRVMGILDDAGITQEEMVMGAWTLTSETVTCSLGVYPGAKPACTVEKHGDAIELDASASSYMFRLLRSFGAYDYEPGCIFGAVTVIAHEVSCTKVVVPGARPACTIVTSIPQVCPHG
jgi:hypothetical protein